MTTLKHLLQRLQATSRTGFSTHGRRCSNHPIPALLVLCLVSCLLFYPALDLYFWTSSSPHLASHLGGHAAVSGLSRTSRGGGLRSRFGSRERAFADLTVPWQGLGGWAVCEDEKCWERCPRGYGGGDEVVRLVRVLLTSEEVEASREGHVHEAEHGMLERRTLHRGLRFQQALDVRLSAQTLGSEPLGAPLSLFSFWNNSESLLLTDPSLEQTIDTLSASSPLPLGSLLAGRSAHEAHLHRADYLVVTWAIRGRREADEWSFTHRWRDFVSTTNSGDGIASVVPSSSARRRILLRRSRSDASPAPTLAGTGGREPTDDTLLFALAYFIVGMYVYLTLRKLDQVHSRTGLVFTGLVEIAVSGILSLSVCALFGIEFDLVPWKLLPFVVAVLGVDNMLLLADAVVHTSIDLPVSERIADGLGSVGFSITISLLAEISAIYCVILIVPSDGMVRELCIFSIVALVVEYCLELTFFLTVLSIDLQRLELADHLRQGSSTAGAGAGTLVDPRSRSSSRKGGARSRTVGAQTTFATTFSAIYKAVVDGIRARQARVATFNVLFMVFFSMWLARPPERYLPAFCTDLASSSAAPPANLNPMPVADDASQALWNQLNPLNSTLLPVIVEPPLIVTFSSAFPLPTPSLFAGRLIRGFRWAFKVVIFPISTTTIALYFVLVYLLKDADKLEAQRNKAAAADLADELRTTEKPLEWQMLTTLEGVHASDIELLATNGVTAVSASALDRHLSVLQAHPKGTHLQCDEIAQDAANLPQSGRRPTTLALSATVDRVAVGYSDGALVLFTLEGEVELVVEGFAEGFADTSLTELAFYAEDNPFASEVDDSHILVVDAAGGLTAIELGEPSSTSNVILVEPSIEARRSSLFGVGGRGGSENVDNPTLCRLLRSGVIEVWQPTSELHVTEEWRLSNRVEVPFAEGKPSVFLPVAIGPLPEAQRLLVIGTTHGHVLAYDPALGRFTPVCVVESAVRQLRCAPASGKINSIEGCTIAASSSSTVKIASLYFSVEPAPTSRDASIQNGSASPASQKITRSLSASYRNSPRLRRVSAARGAGSDDGTSTGAFIGPSFAVDQLPQTFGEADGVNGTVNGIPRTPPTPPPPPSRPPSRPSSRPPSRPSSPGPNSVGRRQSFPSPLLDDTPKTLVVAQIAEDVKLDGRGGWEVVGSRVVGVRRCRRDNLFAMDAAASSPLEAWELWEVNLAAGSNTSGRIPVGTAPLALLSEDDCAVLLDEEVVLEGPLRKRRSATDNQALSALVNQRNGQNGVSFSARHDPLPFSRVRPVASSTGAKATLAIGLGNVVGVLTPRTYSSKSGTSTVVATGARRIQRSRSRSGSMVPPPKATPKKVQ